MSVEDQLAIQKAKFKLACFAAVTPQRQDLPANMDVGYYTTKAQALFDWCVATDTPETSGPVENKTAKQA